MERFNEVDVMINFLLLRFNDRSIVEYSRMLKTANSSVAEFWAFPKNTSHTIPEVLTIMEQEDLISIEGAFVEIEPKGRQVQREGGWLQYLENIKKAKEHSKTVRFDSETIGLLKDTLASNSVKKNPFWKRITTGHVSITLAIIVGTLTTIANWDRIKANCKSLFGEEVKLQLPSTTPVHQDSGTKQKADTATGK